MLDRRKAWFVAAYEYSHLNYLQTSSDPTLVLIFLRKSSSQAGSAHWSTYEYSSH